jgi:hypothetical protein
MFHGFCMRLEITADVFISFLEALRLNFMNVNIISKSGVLITYKQFYTANCMLFDGY